MNPDKVNNHLLHQNISFNTIPLYGVNLPPIEVKSNPLRCVIVLIGALPDLLNFV